jgi:hypothetical protein
MTTLARSLPAAATPVGAVLRLPTGDITVARIFHADPQPGQLTIIDTEGNTWVFGGSERVHVLALP